MENPIKMDDLGVPLFLETPIYNWNKKSTIFNREIHHPPPSWWIFGGFSSDRHVSFSPGELTHKGGTL